MSNVSAEEARDQVRDLYRQWTKACGAEKDYSFFERHLDPAWLYTDFNGIRRGKEEYYRLVAQLLSYEQEMREIDARMVREDLALITGVYHSRAELTGGVKLENTIIFSALWELRDGVWKALLHHTTRVQGSP